MKMNNNLFQNKKNQNELNNYNEFNLFQNPNNFDPPENGLKKTNMKNSLKINIALIKIIHQKENEKINNNNEINNKNKKNKKIIKSVLERRKKYEEIKKGIKPLDENDF